MSLVAPGGPGFKNRPGMLAALLAGVFADRIGRTPAAAPLRGGALRRSRAASTAAR